MPDSFRDMLQTWPVPVIGMVHLQPLPGSPGFDGDLHAVLQAAIRDARALADHGVPAIMIENFGDSPFFPGPVPPITIAAITRIAAAIADQFDLPIGINVLRNDGRAALAIAAAVGASFIRVNILTGARVTDQGVMQGIAHDLMRDRASLNAEHIHVLADVNVKHSAPLADAPLDQQVHDLVERGGADAVIASGSGTGVATDLDELTTVRQAAGNTPVLIGSGVTAASLPDLSSKAEGFIVGSSIKQHGRATEPVDPQRVRELVNVARNLPQRAAPVRKRGALP